MTNVAHFHATPQFVLATRFSKFFLIFLKLSLSMFSVSNIKAHLQNKRRPVFFNEREVIDVIIMPIRTCPFPVVRFIGFQNFVGFTVLARGITLEKKFITGSSL